MKLTIPIISAMDFDGLDEMKRDLKALTRQMAHTLEGELKTLKLKATRCSLRCFREKTEFREALKCERICQDSVKRMSSFMEAKTQPVHRKLQQCLLISEKMAEGIEVEDAQIDTAFSCYEGFKKELMKAQGDIVLEFSYFE
jgi:tRNA U54 and U55 pseudouridine synthase Pus10